MVLGCCVTPQALPRVRWRLFDFKCSSTPHEVDRIIHMPDVLRVISVLLVQGIAGKWHESPLRSPSGISHSRKTVNRIFL